MLPASAALLAPNAALAHGGGPGPFAEWTLDAWLVLPLLLSILWYAAGWARLWRRSGTGRGALARDGAMFASGWLVLAGALVSPLHAWGERSFTLHMVEHELLMLVAAPLLALSRPLAAYLWALPAGWRQALARSGRSPAVAVPWRRLTEPLTATVLLAVALWAWHAPGPFGAALEAEGWHALQHAAFILSSLLFWWSMAHGPEGRRGYGLGALCQFFTAVHTGFLGTLMAFAGSAWYPAYTVIAPPWGLSPLEDQQLAGLVMWVPGGLVHAGAALLLLAKWLQHAGEIDGEGRHGAALD
ncbi:MAG TPA: cytochrome c oxidase assembly protein [Azospirillaceae bacterium]|nr:cytochrome c oxidase assembly protein [Azospirillaceae bacterium]